MTADQYYRNIFDFYKTNSSLSDSMLRSEMDRLGISPGDVAKATGVPVDSVLSRYNAATARTQTEIDTQTKARADLAAREAQWATQQKANEAAWAAQQAKNATDWANQQKMTQNANSAYANAPQTLGDKFASYQSIPIGAQYNPAVTPSGVSPYSMVMSQMQPFQNPYASFVPGTSLGGYNPNLYSQIAVRDADAAAAKAAAENKAANDSLLMYGPAGPTTKPTVYSPLTSSVSAIPPVNDPLFAGVGALPFDVPDTSDPNFAGVGALPALNNQGVVNASFANGGMVRSLLGPNPAGPDDGAGYLDLGEYVIKKSSVNKYGRGLLDMINEGKMPAKKIRSLLD
jgi:hypothetical protein